MTQSTLSTHILNLDAGTPAENLSVELRATDSEGNPGDIMASATTDSDGRASDWPKLDPGTYEMQFQVGDWFKERGLECFYPRVRIEFIVGEPRHYHVPLLLNRFGFSSYRGS